MLMGLAALGWGAILREKRTSRYHVTSREPDQFRSALQTALVGGLAAAAAFRIAHAIA